ncbi:hypothetical protein FA15DRAFT_272337 [Coprinopsis marcescibilis]|uniref:SANT domain-containing protein n=1 Tax=Coprinopsis marcescibilis TaxID=230819 RepID=A0A5C3L336_COPMA|nr:hypothetical protein FA15DRAFT_272337 [Coprinopsis marcescibilis]
MAASGYDPLHSAPLLSRYQSRRSSGPMTGAYDRPTQATHRRTPSPTARRGYDSYAPARGSTSFREGPNVYRINAYRPDYNANTVYTRSPSPDRYAGPSRIAESDSWDRQSAWPTGYNRSTGWQDREPIPPSPIASTVSRGRDDMLATRMFEPQDGWKQHSNIERFGRDDPPPHSSDRYLDAPPRSAPEPSIDSSRVLHRPGYQTVGDRYRPNATKRASNVRGDYDSYRPSYDNVREQRGPLHREENPVRSFRADSVSSGLGRTWDHYEPNNSRVQFPSGSHSRSPERRSNDAVSSSPQRLEPSNFRTPRDDSDFLGKKGLSRRSSRSSIASQGSDAQRVAQYLMSSARGSEPPHHSDKSLDPIKPQASAMPQRTSILSPAQSSPQLNQTFSGPQSILANELRRMHSSSSVSTPPTRTPATPTVAHSNGSLAIASRVLEHPVQPSPASSQNHFSNEIGPTKQRSESPSSDFAPPGLSVELKSNSILPKQNPEPAKKPATPAPSVAKPDASHPEATSSVVSVEASHAKDTPPSTATRPHPSPPNDKQPLTTDVSAHAPPIPPSVSVSVPPVVFSNTQQEPVNDLPPWENKVLLELRPLFPSDALPSQNRPSISDAKTMPEALRAIVMTRLLCDRQTKEDLVNPVLMANRVLAESAPVYRPTSQVPADELFAKINDKIAGRDGAQELQVVRPSLAEHFEQRQTMINDKVQRLSAEYLSLHKKWKAHCDVLDGQQKASLSESEHLLHGRTTRRTSAFTADAVRSDLEMEQVLASLGIDNLTDANYLSSRNAASIPNMISVVRGQVDYVYNDTNHLVKEPSEYYAKHTEVDDWTDEEKRIFIDKFAANPKQFGIIADYLPNKSASQCVDYYYLHKKRLIDFRKVVSQLAPRKRKRRGGGKKKGNALLTDIAQHDAEVGKDNTLSTFVVPSRVAKGKRGGRGAGAAAKANSSTPATERTAVATATSTPQPEPEQAELTKSISEVQVRNKTLQVEEQTPVATPLNKALQLETTPAATPTPEPEGRSKRRKAPSQVQTPASTILVAPTKLAPLGNRPPSPDPKQKRTKRGRKQVKSVAIIEDSPSPPPQQSRSLPPLEPVKSTSTENGQSSRKDVLAHFLWADSSDESD